MVRGWAACYTDGEEHGGTHVSAHMDTEFSFDRDRQGMVGSISASDGIKNGGKYVT